MREATPLDSPAALYALTHYVHDHRLVDVLVSEYATWEHLSTADPTEVAWKVGTWAAQLRLPFECPVLPDLGQGVQILSRYAPEYPSRLLEEESPPVLVYLRGTLPTTPCLGIGGSYYPSPSGVAAARSAARTAVALGLTVVAALDTGCGQAALTEVVARGGRALAICSSPLDAPGHNAGLVERIILLKGAVLSQYGPEEYWSEEHTFRSSSLVAALASAVVLPELGIHPAGGAALARAAIRLGRFLIVPAPGPDDAVQVTATGVTSLAKPRHFSANYFGSSPRLRARVAAGRSAADAVVATPQELQAAISYSCLLVPAR